MNIRFLIGGITCLCVASLDAPGGPRPPGESQAARTLTVFAAASLTEVFTELGTRFETAGLVYVTDVAAARRTVHGVSFAEAGAARTPYPITVVKNAPQPDLAVRFQRLVTADRARSPNHSSCGSLSVSHSADGNLL